MGMLNNILQKLQMERLEKMSNETSDLWEQKHIRGYIKGLEVAESIIFSEQKNIKKECDSLWYKGNPNEIKPNNRGTYIVILKSHFDSDDGIENGKIYIDSDFWDGENWESFEAGEDESPWEVLYFTKLKWIKFPLPDELGIKKNDSLFFD